MVHDESFSNKMHDDVLLHCEEVGQNGLLRQLELENRMSQGKNACMTAPVTVWRRRSLGTNLL